MTISDSTSTWFINGNLYVGYGYGSTGVVNQNGGTITVNGSLYLASCETEGTYNLSGGLLSVDGTVYVGNSLHGHGTFNLSGGTLALKGLQHASSSAFNFSGGTLQANAGFSTSANATLTNTDTINTNGYDVTWTGALSGTGELVKTGDGTLTLSDYSYTGGTYVKNGMLALTNGYTSTSSSTLKIGITPTSNGVLAVTGAAAVDGTLDVISASGDYTAGTKYTFLTATEGVSGAFDTVIDDLAFFDILLAYETNDIYFTLVSSGKNYVDEAHTGNQYAVATYLDDHKSGATGDFATVVDALNLQTGDGARTAFDAMSGELHGSLGTVTLENSDRFLRSIASRMRTQSMMQGDGYASYNPNGDSLIYVNRVTNGFDTITRKMSGWTTWAESYGVGASVAGNGNASGLAYSTGGLMFGMERYLDEYTLFGFGGGYAVSNTTLNDRADWGSIDGGQACAYLHREIEERYLTAIAAYGYNQYSTRRYIDFGNIDRMASASYHGGSYSAYIEAGHSLSGRFAHLQPFAALEYIGVQQNAFTEQDADSIDLDVDATTANAMRGILGSRVFKYYRTNSGHLVTLDASAAWRHEFLNDNRVIDASFTGQTGTAFAVSGVNVDRDAALVGTGLNCAISTHLSVYGNYDLLFSQNYTAHTGLGGFQYLW